MIAIATEEQWERVEELGRTLTGLSTKEVALRMQEWEEQGEPASNLNLLASWRSLPRLSPAMKEGDEVDGRFVLLGRLGTGGMGSVWKAWQSAVERDVAVKMLHSSLVSPSLSGRLQQEIKMLGKLKHPGIVKIFDAGICKHGGKEIPFYAMELVDGESLASWSETWRDSRPKLLRAMADLCGAVQHAHDQEIVHRDLKPANIMMSSEGKPVVLDFGIARMMEGGVEDPEGVFSGTPHYAAPEQHMGRDRDFQSGTGVDVYAAGAILFEMLTGRRLFVFSEGISIAEMRRAILEEPPPKLANMLADCPPDLDEIVGKAVRRDPVDRYYSMAEMACACRRVADALDGNGNAQAVPKWTPAEGKTIPGTSWRLTKYLGKGAVGEVWVGVHSELGDRRVFKFCDTAEKASTLKRELTLFRLLKERVGRNPHFIQLLGLSLNEEPWYLMMEDAEASELEKWCEGQEGGLPGMEMETKVEIVAQVAEALQAAHETGILHRDVKPGNLLIQNRAGGEGNGSAAEDRRAVHVLIADFGIGQIVAADVLKGTLAGFTRSLSLEEHHLLGGTLMYMAPEVQEKKPATARSDIYSLGVVLWQLLRGNLHAALDPVHWPDWIEDSLLRADLMRCLAGAPGERWASAGELAASLRALPERRAAEARRREEVELAKEKEYRAGVLRTTMVAAGVVVMLGGAGWYALDRSLAANAAEVDARRKTFSAGLSELGRLSLGNAANRKRVAVEWIERMKPASLEERRSVAEAYAPILEREDWVVTDGARRHAALQVVGDARLQFALAEETDGSIAWLREGRASPVWKLPRGEGDPVLAVAERGKLAAVGRGRDVRIYEGETGAELASIAMEAMVTALAWHPDGRQLAIGFETDSGKGVIEFCEGPGWNSRRRLEHPEAFPLPKSPSGLCYSPDGAFLAHWSTRSLHLLLWDVGGGKLAAFAYHPSSVVAAVWAEAEMPGGKPVVFTAAGDAFLYRWQVEAGNAVALDNPSVRFPLRAVERRGHHCLWSRLIAMERGKYLVAADAEGSAWLFDVKTGAALAETQTGAPVLALGVNGRQIVVAGKNGQMQQVSHAGSLVKRTYFSQRLGAIEDFDILPDGSVCAGAGPGGLAVFIGEEECTPLREVNGEWQPDLGTYCRGVRFVDGKRLVCSFRMGDRMLGIDGRQVKQVPPPVNNAFIQPASKERDRPARIALDANFQHWLTGRAGSILWASVSGTRSVAVSCESNAAPREVAISPDGSAFAWTDTAGRAWRRDVVQKESELLIAGGAERVAFVGNRWCVASTRGGLHAYAGWPPLEVPVQNLNAATAVDFAAQQSVSRSNSWPCTAT